jgi:hypothetical protein
MILLAVARAIAAELLSGQIVSEAARVSELAELISGSTKSKAYPW